MTAESDSEAAAETGDRKTGPMRYGRWAVVALGVLVVAALAGSLLMPRHPVVTRSIEIDAPPEMVFPLVSDLRRFGEWSPWPETDFVFTGPAEGVGQNVRWDTPIEPVGTGSMTIAALEPDTVEVVRATGRGESVTTFAVAPKGAGSTVTWNYTTDLGFDPVGRYTSGELEFMIGPEFERGLANLKALAERPPPEEEEE